MSTGLASAVTDYLAHKRALGRKFATEEANLRLLLSFADQQGLARLDQLDPVLLDAFFSSRPRTRPRSFNHLVGIVACFLDWTVAQELLAASPLPPCPGRDHHRLPHRGPRSWRRLFG